MDLLAAIKSSKRPADTTALQTALGNILRISNEEIKNLGDRMPLNNTLSEEEIAFRDILIADIADLKLHINTVRLDTTQDAGPTAMNSIAQKFKEWREDTYEKTTRKASAFASAFESQEMIQIARTRLNAILKDEKRIRTTLSTSKTASFARLVKKTQGGLRTASDLNDRAKSQIIAGNENGVDVAENLLEESRNLISAAYDDFIAMSKLVKK
jgi:hypothetical protein